MELLTQIYSQMDFIALDFETANSSRASVCQIGLCVVKDNVITDTYSWLVKPEDNYYLDFNISIHGITPEKTKNEPEFDEVWKEVTPLIEGQLVIAHNAAFDMYVLKDSLDLYNLEYPNINTMCSYILSKRAFPGLLSYNLASVAFRLGIEQEDYHNAEDDARVCAEIALKVFEKGNINNFSDLTELYRIVPGSMCSENKGYISSFSKKDSSKILDARKITGDSSKHDPDNLFYGKSIVFTGTLTSMPRKDAMKIIADIGGTPENDITSRTNFLIVGQQSCGVVGRDGLSGKQKKAMQLLQKGQEIEILSEFDFYQNI